MRKPRSSANNAEAFWEMIVKTDTCWLWTGSTDTHGYGSVRWDGRTIGTHRVAWSLTFGPIPKGASVLHHCDVRNCVNPSCLFLGTQKVNMEDAAAKGRLFGRATASGDSHGSHTVPESVLRADKNGNAALTEDQVRTVRELCGKMSQVKVAALFRVHQVTISRIIRRKTYWAIE